jgi:hypothetical protein
MQGHVVCPSSFDVFLNVGCIPATSIQNRRVLMALVANAVQL